MIAIFDTNVLISSLINLRSLPAQLIEEWIDRRFSLVTSEDQIREFRLVSRYEKIAPRLSPPKAGRLVRKMRSDAIMLGNVPIVDASRDPKDNYLLGMAQAASADFLVTGDKTDLLSLGRHATTRIISVREFAHELGLE